MGKDANAYLERMFAVAQQFDEEEGIAVEDGDLASPENMMYVMLGEIALIREEFDEYKESHS